MIAKWSGLRGLAVQSHKVLARSALTTPYRALHAALDILVRADLALGPVTSRQCHSGFSSVGNVLYFSHFWGISRALADFLMESSSIWGSARIMRPLLLVHYRCAWSSACANYPAGGLLQDRSEGRLLLESLLHDRITRMDCYYLLYQHAPGGRHVSGP